MFNQHPASLSKRRFLFAWENFKVNPTPGLRGEGGRHAAVSDQLALFAVCRREWHRV